MKKIPTLFKREFERRHVKSIVNEVTPGLEWVLEGKGVATVKVDGSCCAIIDGVFHRRYDAKVGKTPPPNAIPCCDPDPTTGHWPHWLPVSMCDPGANWHLAAYFNAGGTKLKDGTYEAVGSHFQSNPYNLQFDVLVRHGIDVIEDCPRTFDGIREYLWKHNVEGIVFWNDGETKCKIKRSDFGFTWPIAGSDIKLHK